MQIRVVAFASARDALGGGEVLLDAAPGARLSDLRRLLEERYPDLESLWPRLAVAVDGQLAPGDPELSEGSEVALLPPVSGGQGSATQGPVEPAVHVGPAPIAPQPLLDAVADSQRGALMLFLGTVRDHHEGREVRSITYSAYHSMATAALQRIVDDLQTENPELRIAIHHRTGTLGPGEASVGIATASPHRDAAYAASRLALERLKREVPIWKHEHYGNGESRWREEEALQPAD